MINPDKTVVRLKPAVARTEDALQSLIADHPDLIGEADGELLLVSRELGIPDEVNGSTRWSIDHLFVTRSAIPVLVEVKRSVDTRIRREVVGQMLDYAANGVVYWPAGSIRDRFGEKCKSEDRDPGIAIEEFGPDAKSAQDFWEQVDANLKAGRIKLIFAADQIPTELARIVEFLNEQMTAEVRAIELRHFEGKDGTLSLVPRIIGETEMTRAKRRTARSKPDEMDKESWLAMYIAPKGSKALENARAVLSIVESVGAKTGVPSTQGSIYSMVKGSAGKPCYPIFVLKNASVQLAFGWVKSAPALTEDAARRHFYDRFNAAVGPLSSLRIDGWPSFPLARLDSPESLKAFEQVTREFFEYCQR